MDKRRVVVLIDANTGEVLECPADVEVKFILWERICSEVYPDPCLIDELDKAILTDLDKALQMSEALVSELFVDGGEG